MSGNYFVTGEYSCLRVKLLFARQLSFFLVTVYVPCSMTVSVSWMSFWLDHKAVPARVALGVTTLLAMSTTQASIQNSLPPVAYTKAIDVWSGVGVVFVFSALLEYALVNYASRFVSRVMFIVLPLRCNPIQEHLLGALCWMHIDKNIIERGTQKKKFAYLIDFASFGYF